MSSRSTADVRWVSAATRERPGVTAVDARLAMNEATLDPQTMRFGDRPQRWHPARDSILRFGMRIAVGIGADRTGFDRTGSADEGAVTSTSD